MIILFLLAVVYAAFDPEDPIWRRHKLGGKSTDFWLDTPTRSLNADGFYYNVKIDGQRERFWLQSKPHLLSKGLVTVVRDGENSMVTHRTKDDEDCAFEGHSVSHNGSSIALYGCGVDLHGLVITADGEYIFIQPKDREHSQHIIRKRSIGPVEHTCLFDPVNDPDPEERTERRPRSFLSRQLQKEPHFNAFRPDSMTIELAVFADDAMWRHFQRMYGNNADIELHKFVLAAVNNIDILYAQRSIQPRMKIKVVRYEVLKTPPTPLQAAAHRSGDVDRLLDAFCLYQHQINSPNDYDPKHWDHALLFSGHDLYRDNLYTVAGYAPVKGMCTGSRSCTINEGLDFGSVFVVTHEMGHSLGMYHDGDNECDLRCCIMSPSVGSGKTHWSKCSVKEMRSFIGRMGNDGRTTNCLMDSPLHDEEVMLTKDRESPGQLFTLDDQCEIFHGECWKHELKDGQKMDDVCSMVWCGNGEGVIRTAHPALEGSYCGYNKLCQNGICTQVNRILPFTHGGWSQWNDNPSSTCGGQCSVCKIQGQIRLRRSIRKCNNPSPNNNGAQCQGSEARGLRCSDQVCFGLSPNQYAVQECRRAKDDPIMPNPQLSGEGLQFELAPCKIWCQLTHSNNIRTVANFPDGTPCGGGRYCIKGECRPLQCQGTVVAMSYLDCPFYRIIQPIQPKVKETKKPSAYKEEKKPPFWQQWSGWSAWSPCIGCGSAAYRLRARRCLAGECVGQAKQKGVCKNPCSVSPSDDWGPWSGCSVSCGTGQKLRKKKSCLKECTEVATCSMAPCVIQQGLWSQWSTWNPCSVSCGVGREFRIRACSTNNCPGATKEIRNCYKTPCPSLTPPSSPPPHSSSPSPTDKFHDISWSEWGQWSHCSKQCGTGTKIRRRQCMRSPCTGDNSETLLCVGSNCDKWRIPREAISNGKNHSSGSTLSRPNQ